MKRFSARDLALYLLLILLMLFAVNSLQQMYRADDPSYNQVRILFEQGKVKSFSVKDNVLTMVLRGDGDETYTQTYTSSSTSSAPRGSSRTMITPWACRTPGGTSSCPISL